MNYIGRILVALILIMSVVFMTFSIMVYSTHTNWKNVVERKPDEVKGNEKPGLRYQLDQLKNENTELQAQLEKLISQHKEEIAAKADAIVKLESQKKAVTDENALLVKERDELSRKEREAVAALDSSSKNLEKLTVEVKGLRDEIRKSQEDRDTQFAKVVKLTDENHKVQQELTRTAERRDQLVAQVAHARKLLAPYNKDVTSSLDPAPPALRGKVLAINDEKMAEISLGSDDGIAVGHTVDVFRGNKYIGRLVVLTTATDKAVAKIDTKFTKTAVQTGDDVATRLRVTAEGVQNGKARL
jgi:hypothetical protein